MQREYSSILFSLFWAIKITSNKIKLETFVILLSYESHFPSSKCSSVLAEMKIAFATKLRIATKT